MEHKKTIVLLNASALKDIHCELKFARTVMEGYATKVSSVDIEYGSAFHLFVAEMNKTGGQYAPSMKAALEYFRQAKYTIKAKKDWMTAQHLTKTCMDYWEYYNKDGKKDEWQSIKTEQGEALVEMKFSIPFFVNDEVEILLCGTIDDICKRNNGCYAIRDYKTTSVWNKTSYLASYRLNPQLIFYIFVLYEYAHLYPDSIFTKICTDKGRVAAFIDGIFLKSAEVTFDRSEMFFFTEKELSQFRKMLTELVVPKILRIVRQQGQLYPEGIVNGTCHNVFGACKYSLACVSPDSVCAGHILHNNFIKKPYNPLAH